MIVSTEFSKLAKVKFVKIPAWLWMPVSAGFRVAVWAREDLINVLLPAKLPKLTETRLEIQTDS